MNDKRLKKAILKIGGPEKAAAILEAAGHTDTMACLKFLERVNEDGEMRDEQGLLLFPLAQIRSLLRKSLPDKED